jgi:hypothetical protein
LFSIYMQVLTDYAQVELRLIINMSYILNLRPMPWKYIRLWTWKGTRYHLSWNQKCKM